MLFASCLGVILAMVAITFISIAIVGSIASSVDKSESVESNSILRLTFDREIPEYTNNVESQSFSSLRSNSKTLGLHDVADAIKRAKDDDKIKGILIEPENLTLGGFASARTLRQALVEFKKSGKFIYASSKYYTQGSYYMSSVADQVYLNPLGIMEVKGFSVQTSFYKNMLDRLGVNMQIFYAGKFKGATEPFRLTKFSPENKLQYHEFLKDFYSIWLSDVSASRKINPIDLKNTIDNYLADSPENAKKFGLVDQVAYRQDLMEALRKKMGLEKSESVHFANIYQYASSNPAKLDLSAKDKIAVLYAEGAVVDGKGNNGSIGDLRYVKAIEDIAADDHIKAIVLRINSGGGSALSSETMWYALTKAKASGKKLIVSMGDYAASGGYYIACMADSIFAEPNTVTGSIGVFSVIPSIEKAMGDKLGVTFDSIKTGPFATGLTPFFNLSPAEGQKMQTSTERMYELFLKRVADGRHMQRDAVHEIAQGRVWSGQDAIGIGLVDKLGGLDKAIAAAAKMAGLKKYRTTNYPRLKEPLQQFISEFLEDENGQETRMLQVVKKEFPQWAPAYRLFSDLKRSNGMQARIMVTVPFE